ncbi:MAG: hypothetical protein WAV98_00245 [Minisyncoccia bacterium]
MSQQMDSGFFAPEIDIPQKIHDIPWGRATIATNLFMSVLHYCHHCHLPCKSHVYAHAMTEIIISQNSLQHKQKRRLFETPAWNCLGFIIMFDISYE